MSMMASQITSLTIVYSTVYSGADQRKHQSSASLAFVREIHRWLVNSPHKGPVTQKLFPFDDVIIKFVQQSHYIRTCMSCMFWCNDFVAQICTCSVSATRRGTSIVTCRVDTERERDYKFIGLFGDRGYRGRTPCHTVDRGTVRSWYTYPSYFSLNNSRRAPHSSSVRISYGVSFVIAKFDWSFATVIVGLCAQSYCIWLRCIECVQYQVYSQATWIFVSHVNGVWG